MKRLLLALAFLSVAAPVEAAPVLRPADLSLELTLLPGSAGLVTEQSGFYYICYDCIEVSIQRSAQVSVDATAGKITLGPDVLAQTEPIEWLVDGATGIAAVSVEGFSHGEGIFSVGGAAGLSGEPPCPLSTPGACVGQTGFGGAMALTGTYFVHVLPNVIVIPVALGGFGTSGSLNDPFTMDFAPWTVGTASIRFTGSTSTVQGAITASGFRLVSPTYVSALGNLLPAFASLEITFTDGLGLPGFVAGQVPEPATWLLVAGATGLGLALLRKG